MLEDKQSFKIVELLADHRRLGQRASREDYRWLGDRAIEQQVQEIEEQFPEIAAVARFRPHIRGFIKENIKSLQTRRSAGLTIGILMRNPNEVQLTGDIIQY